MCYFCNLKNITILKKDHKDLKKKRVLFLPTVPCLGHKGLSFLLVDWQSSFCNQQRSPGCVPVPAPGGPHPALTRWAQVEPPPKVKVKGKIKVPWRFPSSTGQETELAHA